MPKLFPTFPEIEIHTDSSAQQRGYCPGYSFDFKSGDFLLDGAGRLVLIDGESAWEQWCIKALGTQRGACAAYADEFGMAGEAALLQPTPAAQQSHISRTITEALMRHPCTSAVRDFQFTAVNDALYVSFTVEGRNYAQFYHTLRYDAAQASASTFAI